MSNFAKWCMVFQKYFENYGNTRIEDYDLHSVRKFHNRIISNGGYMASNFLEIILYQTHIAQLRYFMNCDGKPSHFMNNGHGFVCIFNRSMAIDSVGILLMVQRLFKMHRDAMAAISSSEMSGLSSIESMNSQRERRIQEKESTEPQGVMEEFSPNSEMWSW